MEHNIIGIGRYLRIGTFEPSVTFIFQFVNTGLLLCILIGIPYLIIKMIKKSKEKTSRIDALEKKIDILVERSEK